MDDSTFLTTYKTQVPARAPKTVIEDIDGRLWALPGATVTSKEEMFLKWNAENPNDTWYVWFHKGLECPDIDDKVRLGEKSRTVTAVYRVYRNKRAVVIFDS